MHDKSIPGHERSIPEYGNRFQSKKKDYLVLFGIIQKFDGIVCIPIEEFRTIQNDTKIDTKIDRNIDGFGNRFSNGFSLILGGEMKASWN